MRHTFLLIAAMLATPTAMHAAERKPNILLIYSDDHGWADLGAQGVNAEIRTPNLDQLARDGVRFARGYVSAPQCVPSRAGVITGRYQQRFGVEDNAKGPLPLAELTIAERLKPAGYVTGMVGKWHLDIGAKGGGGAAGRTMRAMPEHMPHGQGFDEYWRGEMRQFYASHDLKGRPFTDAPHLVTDARFRVVVQTEAALSFLDRRAPKPEQPWFLYLAWYAPHVPLESPEPWFSHTPENLPLPRRQALAMIAGMDDGLGRIRAKLREMGAEKDTLIFFIGDNGAPLGGSWNGSLNVPLVGQKGMLAEGGIRTPFVAAWPGKLPPGVVYDQPVISLDVAATAVALAGQPHDAKLDGVNIIPFVTGEKAGAPHERLFWRWGSLDVAGPVTLTVRVRTKKAGKAGFAWRTRTEKDFTAENVASCEWGGSADWQEVKVELPVKGALLHLRMTPPKGGEEIEIQSITLAPAKGKPSVFDFSKAPSAP